MYVKILTPNVMVQRGRAFGRWSVLYKRDPRELSPPSASWGHSEKMTIHEPGDGASVGSESASTLILDFPASRTMKIHLLLEAIQPMVTCYSSQNGLRQKSDIW